MDLKTINKKLDTLLKAQERKPAPLTIEEACSYLKIKKSTMYQLTSKRLIPYYKPNGQIIYFDVEDLEQFAYSHKIETIEQIRDKF